MITATLENGLMLFRDRWAPKNQYRVYVDGDYIGFVRESGYIGRAWTFDDTSFHPSKYAAARALREERGR